MQIRIVKVTRFSAALANLGLLTTVLCVPVTTMVKRALSIFKPTAKDSMLAPANPVCKTSESCFWHVLQG